MDRKWLTFAVLAAGLVVVSLLVGLSADGGSTGPPLQLERATTARHAWSLESDGYPPAPHIHQPASPIELGKIDRCEITGTKVELSGRLGIR